MLIAYRDLLEAAKEFAFKAEQTTWEALGHAIENAEQKISALEVLSAQEVAQVQQDLKADLEQIAEFLNHFEQDASDFIQMEWHVLENFLIQKSADLADPTDLMVLRMRLMAAMEKSDPNNTFKHSGIKDSKSLTNKV